MQTSTWRVRTDALTVKGVENVNSSVKDVTIQKVKYRADFNKGIYYVEPIFVEYVNEIYSIEYSCGVYSCAAKGEKWELDPNQPASKTVINGANLKITIDGTEGIAHFPTPSETGWTSVDGFWFSRQQNYQQTSWWPSLKYYSASDTTGTTPYYKQFGQVVCDYDAATDTYTVDFRTEVRKYWDTVNSRNVTVWQSYGTYTITSTGTQWTLSLPARQYETY
jgi:hypothetical protein